MKIAKALLMLLFLFAVVVAEEPEKKVFTAVIGPDGIQKVSIVGGEYYFDPNHIIVKVNVPVELSVRKAGGFVPHDIQMNAPEAGMKFDQSFGTEPTIISFTPIKVGTYPFSCTKKFLFFKSHEEKGMKGIIEVVE